MHIGFKIIKATFLIFPLCPSRCVSPLLSLTGVPRGWCHRRATPAPKPQACSPYNGETRREIDGKWEMSRLWLRNGKDGKSVCSFSTSWSIDIIYTWYVLICVFSICLQCLAYVSISFATFFWKSSFWTTCWMYCAHGFPVLECVAKICKEYIYVLLHF